MNEITRAIMWGGVLCGTLDAVAAMTSFAIQGTPPARVWQNVSSGLLGAQSFQKGWRTTALGLLLHFLIAFIAASVFCLAAHYIPWMLRVPIVAGVLYGIAVFLVMSLVVLPRSAMPKRRVTRAGIISQLIIHMLFVGLPISLSASAVMATAS
jgi:uncharacterized membrane protein YagU involved in acid resistance